MTDNQSRADRPADRAGAPVEIELTKAMLKAGVEALGEYEVCPMTETHWAALVFRAMASASKLPLLVVEALEYRVPTDTNEDRGSI